MTSPAVDTSPNPTRKALQMTKPKKKRGATIHHPPSQYQRHGLPRWQTVCPICGWHSTDQLRLELHKLECEVAAHNDRAEHYKRQLVMAARREELTCTACGGIHVFSSQQEACDIKQWEKSVEFAEMQAETQSQHLEDGR